MLSRRFSLDTGVQWILKKNKLKEEKEENRQSSPSGAGERGVGLCVFISPLLTALHTLWGSQANTDTAHSLRSKHTQTYAGNFQRPGWLSLSNKHGSTITLSQQTHSKYTEQEFQHLEIQAGFAIT